MEWDLDEKEVLVDLKKSLIVTVKHGNDISVFLKQNLGNGEESS